MSHRHRIRSRFALVSLALALGWLGADRIGFAQVVDNAAVGGIRVSAEGLLASAQRDDQLALSRQLVRQADRLSDDLARFTQIRKLSLRKLQQALAARPRPDAPLPPEVRYLAGLQRIQFVFVFPEDNDIVLVGPAEGWKSDDRGFVVGRTTGRPVMLLDDLLVALRTARATARGGISCSINPRQEGLTQLQKLVGSLKTIGNPRTTSQRMERTLGPQNIRVTGVPATSHFARVLVSADYDMKRLAMGLDRSPLRSLPSFLQMAKASGRGLSNMMPRWWLAPDYDSLARDGDGLAWELRGAGVRCETESDFLQADGAVQQGRKVDPTAQRWADALTKNYEALSQASPIFGQLQNVMDLAIVSALVVEQRLADRAGMSLARLLDEDNLAAMQFHAPQQVHSQASLLKKGRNWIISVSGGVQLNAYDVIRRTETTDEIASTRNKAYDRGASWWWD